MFEVQERYPSGNRPTIDQLMNKLIIHAFLDRKGDSGHQVGFVNDFLLGSFVGENLLEEKDSWIGTERFIDFILTSYIPRSSLTKLRIYNILNEHLLDYLNLQKRVYVDNYLYGAINRNIENDFFSSLEFREKFSNDVEVKNCIFSDCEFHDVEFDFIKIFYIHFINCDFYNCLIPVDLINQN